MIDFVIHIHNIGGKVTKKEQHLFALQYYALIWHLRDNNLVIQDGMNNKGEKVWKLTENGEKLAKLFIQIKEIFNGNKGKDIDA
jgi:hypothetical protein